MESVFTFFERSLDLVHLRQAVVSGWSVVYQTYLLTALLEVCSQPTVRRVLSQKGGQDLYRQGLLYSIFNPLFIGLPVYALAGALFLRYDDQNDVDHLKQALQIVWIFAWHAVQYYAIHKAFHENPKLYQHFHKFHHLFHTHVPPSAANAVTTGEYFFAYVIPFLAPLATAPLVFGEPLHSDCAYWATSIISVCNILVHTPALESWSLSWVPSFWVSTHDHLEHHRKLYTHYASPTLNVDNLVAKCGSYFQKDE